MATFIAQLMEPEMAGQRRRVILTVIVTAAFLLVAVLVFWPIIGNFRAKQREIGALEQQLASLGYTSGVDALLNRQRAAEATRDETRQTWSDTRERFRVFSDYYFETKDKKGIDYLAAVADERTLLTRDAGQKNLRLPQNLGMPNQLKSDDNAAMMLMQLKVVSSIVQLAAEERMGRIVSIEPLPSVVRADPNGGEPYLAEFPVRVEFETEMQPLLRFINHTARVNVRAPDGGTEETALIVKGVRVEKSAPEDSVGLDGVNEANPTLRVVLVLEGLAILKDPPQQAVTPAPPAQTQRPEPKGF